VGIEKDYASGVATLAALIDTLVDMINLKAVLTDSVTAEDSVTYIKLVSNFSGGQFAGRWSIIMVTTGGTGTLDSAAHVSQATVAMVCDTMVALINADAGLDSHMTASDSGTYYMVTADKKGVLFFGAVFGGTGASLTADSLQDTAHTQANVTSYSTDSGTVGICPVSGYLHASGHIILRDGQTGQHPALGNVDSAEVHLYTYKSYYRKKLDSVKCAQVPCTLDFTIPYVNIAGADSTMYRTLDAFWWVTDSSSDSTKTITYPLSWDITLK
jgi:hypothetical protein